MIKRRGFNDEDETFFTTEEHWGISMGGVAWIRTVGRCDLFLSPETARAVASELITIADSVEKQQLEFERNKK